MKILFIATGGTIDKDYPHTKKGWAFEFGEPAVKHILEKIDPSFQYKIITPFQKDSLEMTDIDRKELSHLISSSNEEFIVITHGTDTMIETARYLDKKIGDKIIVITGAMRPERFSNSDAAANLGLAIGALNLIDSGIYIAMHGIVNPYNKIKRDMNSGKYY